METFLEIIHGDKPVLVDFYATWCGPCKTMDPLVDVIGKEMQGIARVLKIDIDKNQHLAIKYQIRGVPTFMIFKKGDIVWKRSGGLDKENLKNQLLSFV